MNLLSLWRCPASLIDHTELSSSSLASSLTTILPSPFAHWSAGPSGIAHIISHLCSSYLLCLDFLPLFLKMLIQPLLMAFITWPSDCLPPRTLPRLPTGWVRGFLIHPHPVFGSPIALGSEVNNSFPVCWPLQRQEPYPVHLIFPVPGTQQVCKKIFCWINK